MTDLLPEGQSSRSSYCWIIEGRRDPITSLQIAMPWLEFGQPITKGQLILSWIESWELITWCHMLYFTVPSLDGSPTLAVWQGWLECRYIWWYTKHQSPVSSCHARVLQVGWVAFVAFLRIAPGCSDDLAFHFTALWGNNLVSFTKGLNQRSWSYHWNAMAGEPLDLVVTILTEFPSDAKLTAPLNFSQSMVEYCVDTCPYLTVAVSFRLLKYF